MEQKRSNEIDVIASVKKVLAEWKLLLKVLVISGVIGVVIALGRARFYTSTVLLAPEAVDASAMGKLGTLGSMVGLNLSSSVSSDAIYPDIYPEVIYSTDFIADLFYIPVRQLDSEECKPYYLHLIEDVHIPFWSYPMIWVGKFVDLFKEKEPPLGTSFDKYRMSKKETRMLDAIRGNIFAEVDKKTSVITIRVTDFDPQVSAMMADTIMTRLQNYITLYRTKKARHDLAYIEEICQQSYAEYLEAQKKYAAAADSHRDVLLYSVNARLTDLENDMQLKFTAYSNMKQQEQLARNRVQEKTPAFTVFQAATIPALPSSTPKLFVVIVVVFLGGILDVVWVLFLRDVVRKKKR